MPHRPLPLALVCALAAAAAPAAEENDEESKWDVASPPGESRRVDIDTTTGTWMSLDVSPDGETVVFDLLGISAYGVGFYGFAAVHGPCSISGFIRA